MEMALALVNPYRAAVVLDARSLPVLAIVVVDPFEGDPTIVLLGSQQLV